MSKKLQPTNKFNAGDTVFVCDGGKYHGSMVKITKVNNEYSQPRYDGIVLQDKTEFSFEKETDFCAIEMGTCELCGSPEGIVKPQYPVKEYGDIFDISITKFPYAVTCICNQCQNLLNLNKEKLNQRNKMRINFRDTERARRKKNRLCEDCGGEIQTSGPFMVYEGTYETRYRCTRCGKGWAYT